MTNTRSPAPDPGSIAQPDITLSGSISERVVAPEGLVALPAGVSFETGASPRLVAPAARRWMDNGPALEQAKTRYDTAQSGGQ